MAIAASLARPLGRLFLPLLGLTAACAEPFGSALPMGTPTSVQLQTVASNPSTTMSGVVLNVTGIGIPDTLVFSLGTPSSTGQTSQTTITIPAGPARTFTVRGYTGAVVSHEGSLTRDVTRAGLTLKVHMTKLMGADTVKTSVEDFNLALDDSSTFVADAATTTRAAGATFSLTAKMTYAFTAADSSQVAGAAVAGKTVTFASTNPGIISTFSATSCTTSASGTCTVTATVASGATSGQTVGVVANASGIARSMTVTVQ